MTEFWLLVVWLMGMPFALAGTIEALSSGEAKEQYHSDRLVFIGTVFVLVWPVTLLMMALVYAAKK